ncbi:MAG: hypothetical protein Q4B21_02055 [Bacteroidia bacterium]|nr:hypothetical protein [Bacteroidia bacterium]
MEKNRKEKFSTNQLLSFIKENKKDIILVIIFAFAAYFITSIIVDWDQFSSAFMAGWNSVE